MSLDELIGKGEARAASIGGFESFSPLTKAQRQAGTPAGPTGKMPVPRSEVISDFSD